MTCDEILDFRAERDPNSQSSLHDKCEDHMRQTQLAFRILGEIFVKPARAPRIVIGAENRVLYSVHPPYVAAAKRLTLTTRTIAVTPLDRETAINMKGCAMVLLRRIGEGAIILDKCGGRCVVDGDLYALNDNKVSIGIAIYFKVISVTESV
jgi:hypothetical protein